MQLLFPKKHKHHRIVLWLMAGEFPLTIVMLTLTGIASHDLYRTLLWQDGADNGFNSAPNEALYAAANYQPFKTPMVWSDFTTDYNLVMGVLSTFFLITKLPTHWMKLFYPPVAVAVHGSLVILYIVSAAYQAGSDTSDPRHPQPGAPWYIAKSCSVASKKSNIPYCMQAKALFAVTILMIVYYVVILGFNIHSCFITPEEREAILEQREERRIEKEFEEEIIKSPSMIPMTPGSMPQGPGMVPRTPGVPPIAVGGSFSPYAPRTLAFNRLGNASTASDLPLRDNSRATQPQYPSPQSHEVSPESSTGSPMYFPPPPKKAAKA
ncbi:hypothetical protein N7489_011744 [Penicillium chrysogenum]|uniref:Uncharacterized protein n=1 Tax=Penicillium chrysogenum TaxID=5076 RepID=A0ABQ8W3F9_PENCH|nr:uncharacterized protein N7489_011744 [Penicillium chrysogenum]KAJ5231036.1 hypothetical protein N7489_011744 [Penicillium chrysogenum]KAJ5253364.1 hypothetical protein N7505_012027 [Penicillium chrysogenum]KAJ5268420.1 hypothetical protein N7524_005879 [Penicillium chrysogenum]KAJ6162817.1 hypothetical protein N7497_002796 [Penicillium chrysogenum]